MKRLTWLITGIVGLTLWVIILIFEIAINYTLFTNDSVTNNQIVTNITGIIMVCYGWILLIDLILKKIRSLIIKHIK